MQRVTARCCFLLVTTVFCCGPSTAQVGKPGLNITGPASAQEVIDIGARLEPLIDEYLVAKKAGALRLQLHRPVRQNDSITLTTLQKAATVVGREVRLELL